MMLTSIGPGMHVMRIFVLAGIIIFFTACQSEQGSVSSGPWIPPKTFVADPVLGQKIFAKHCAKCHGRGGKGTDKGPPFVHKVYEPSHHSDVAFYMAIRNGVQAHHWSFGNMPPVPMVSAEQAGHIVAYVRKLQRNAGIF